MNIKILIDMNLTPDWKDVFQKHGWPAVHWSSIGNGQAPDREIFDWAMKNEHVVFTNDLDFSSILALTHNDGPEASSKSADRMCCPIEWKQSLLPHCDNMMRIFVREQYWS